MQVLLLLDLPLGLQQQGNVQRTTTSSKVVVNEGNFVGGSFPSALQTCSVETLFYNESNWVHWSLAPNCTLLLWRVQFNPAPTKLQMHVSSIEKRMKRWLTPLYIYFKFHTKKLFLILLAFFKSYKDFEISSYRQQDFYNLSTN